MRTRHPLHALAVLLLYVGCSDDPVTKAVGEGCLLPTDCTTPLTCAFRRCHSQCLADRDCAAGQHCVGAEYPKTGVCLLDDESNCTRHSDCPTPLVCGRRLRCEPQCQSDRDCLTAQVCAQGSCTDSTNVTDGGPSPAAGKENDTCIHNSDCTTPLVCKAGFCAAECVNDRDCPIGLSCGESVCRLAGDAGTDATTDADGATDTAPADAPPGFGAACTYTSECKGSLVCRSGHCAYECLASSDCPKGFFCYSGSCFGTPPDSGGVDAGSDGASEGGAPCTSNDDCDDKNWCNGVERCLLGKCAASAEGPCDSHSSCVVDGCDEAAKTCKHTKIAGTDVDGDGQLDLSCGGTDCDDKDPLTYAGAPERCDGKDNSCNGVVDEYAVVPRGAAGVSAPTGVRLNTGGVGLSGGRLLAFSVAAGVCGGGSTRLLGQVIDKGTAGTEATITTSTGCGGGTIIGASGGPSAAIVGYQAGAQRTLHIVKDDLSVLATHVLNPAGITPTGGDLDAVWTGTRWIAGWTRNITTTPDGRFGFFFPDGTADIRGLPSSDGSSVVANSARVRVAYNATTVAVAWTDASNEVQLSVLDASGGKLVGPVKVGTGTVAAVAGTSLGYVVFHVAGSASQATFVSNAGVVGKSLPVGGTFLAGHGAFDAARGEGAAVILAADGMSFYYARKDLGTGLERSLVYTPPGIVSGDTASLTVLGPDLYAVHGAMNDDKARAFKIGCLP